MSLITDLLKNPQDLESEKNQTSYKESAAPDGVIFTYFFLLIIGIFTNLLVIITLLRIKRSGILLLILQLAITDVLLSQAGLLEIWSLKANSWCFPQDICPLFSGGEILTNTLTIYFIISFNFHVISQINLEIFEMKKGNKNPLTSCRDDSNECLVKRSENSPNRTITIDYSRKKHISVIFPSILVWFICLSLSIPEFTLSSTVKLSNNNTLCTIVDGYYGYLLQKLLLIFRFFIPEPLLFISLIILLLKLYKGKYSKNVEQVLAKSYCNMQALISFAVCLSVAYFITSFQREVMFFRHTMVQTYKNDSIENFKMPPFHNMHISEFGNLYLSMLHYSSSVFRPILYLFLLPDFMNIFKEKILVCVS